LFANDLACLPRAVIIRALTGGGIFMVKENGINFTSFPNAECRACLPKSAQADEGMMCSYNADLERHGIGIMK